MGRRTACVMDQVLRRTRYERGHRMSVAVLARGRVVSRKLNVYWFVGVAKDNGSMSWKIPTRRMESGNF